MKYFLLSITLLLSLFTYSQSTGSIVGKLIDKEYNNEPLAFANVIIKGTTNGTTSDMDGLYAIENLSPGNYTIIYSDGAHGLAKEAQFDRIISTCAFDGARVAASCATSMPMQPSVVPCRYNSGCGGVSLCTSDCASFSAGSLNPVPSVAR